MLREEDIAFASFPAGKKLDWHYHPGGQILLIKEGIGYYQEKGKPKETVRNGAVITCQPDVELWHASPVTACAAVLPVQVLHP